MLFALLHCLSTACSGCAVCLRLHPHRPDRHLLQDAVRKQIITEGMEVEIEEACAMTTRVSPSFIRIGHFDLFGRCHRTPPLHPYISGIRPASPVTLQARAQSPRN
jgi:hypothetical protein